MDHMEMFEVDEYIPNKLEKNCGELQSVNDSLKELDAAVGEVERLIHCLQQYNTFEG